MVRVLTKDGVFMVVSLLQPHVLLMILDFFIKGNDPNHLFTVKIQQMDNIKGYAEKDFLKYFISVKKNEIDVANPKMVEMREKMQDMILIRNQLAQKEKSYNYDNAVEKIKLDQ